MHFNTLVNTILLKEELSRQDKIKALKSLKHTKENIPSEYRQLVDEFINQYPLEELKNMLAMEIRMQEEYNNSSPTYIKALEYAIIELES